MIAMLSTWAFAGEIDVVPLVSNFGIGPLEGRDGWRGGYAAEPWPDYNFGDDIVPQTDDGTTSVTWGTGTALDNWLVQTDVVAVGQGAVIANFQNLDLDACGLVLSNGGDVGYLAFWTSRDAPPPVTLADRERVYLFRVEGGTAVSLGNQAVTLDMDFDHELRLERNDDLVRVLVDGQEAVAYNDPAPLALGLAGVYAYQNGGVPGGGWGGGDDTTV